MATFISTAPMSNTTLQNTKAWMQLVHDAMIAVGCVQTDDSGQLDFDSLTPLAPNTQYSDLGYRVYEINDSLSHAYPIYMKIQFGARRISNSAGQYAAPCCLFFPGFGTDGAGALTSPNIWSTGFLDNNVSGNVEYLEPFSAVVKQDGYIGIALGVGCANRSAGAATASAIMTVLSRTKDSNGNPTGEGIMGAFMGSAQAFWSNKQAMQTIYMPRDATLAPEYMGNSVVGTRTLTGFSDGLAVAQPVFCARNGLTRIPEVISMPAGAVSKGEVFTMSFDDFTDQKFIMLPYNAASSDAMAINWFADSRVPYEFGLAMRWE